MQIITVTCYGILAIGTTCHLFFSFSVSVGFPFLTALRVLNLPFISCASLGGQSKRASCTTTHRKEAAFIVSEAVACWVVISAAHWLYDWFLGLIAVRSSPSSTSLACLLRSLSYIWLVSAACVLWDPDLIANISRGLLDCALSHFTSSLEYICFHFSLGGCLMLVDKQKKEAPD